MKTKSIASRRRFFLHAGAALSVPLAASAALASSADGDAKSRLARLEDTDAIRALHRAYARLVNTGAHEEARGLFADPSTALVPPSLRTLSADGFGEHDVIEIAADRLTATARIHCSVETETAIGPTCTLVEMARAQGEGVLRRSERQVVEHTLVKQSGVWKIERTTYS